MKKTLIKEDLFMILKNKKVLIPIIAVMFVPVLYAGMFLWAFWDPYAKLEDLPVAVVNEDSGAKLEGEHLKLGDDLVKNLMKSKDFGFEVVDKEEGYKNLKDQKYYMLIEIPKDFSENATTLLDDHPKKLELIYTPNESYNFLSAQIGGSAAEKIKTAVSEKVTETYAETMFSKITEVADGVKQASDGAGQLSNGTLDLDKGSSELNDGLATFAEKSIQFDNGMKEAGAGANKLSAGSKELYTGLETLAKKSIEFNNGMKTADSGANEIASGNKTLDDGLGQLLAGHNQLEAASGQLEDGGKQLQSGIEQAKTGIQTINGKMPEVVAGTEQIEKGAKNLSTNLTQWQQGANSTTAGAEKLNQGIVELKGQLAQLMPLLGALPDEKKAELVKALDDLENGSAQLKAGTKGLSDAAGQLSTGSGVLSTKLGELNKGQKALQAGVSQLSDGSLLLEGGANKLVAGQQEFSAGMEQFGQKFTEAKAGADKLAGGSTTLLSGMNKLTDGSNALTSGAGQLASGSGELKNGAADLTSGMNQLTAGADAITSGAGQLADGSDKLKDGTSMLNDGAKELADKLSDGAKEASKVHSSKNTYNMMAAPVKLDSEKLNHVPNYGTGFAPYFLSLGLFVGALLLSIVFPIRDASILPASGFSWFASKFSILAAVGIIQALVADAILLLGLDLQVQSTSRFILFSIITSLTFVALIQLLVSVLADAGRFIAIIILIFQLTTSAGTFPLELIPNFLQHFNAFLPMTYTVSGFKAVISSGDFSYMWQNLIILVGYIVSFALLTTAYFTMRRSHQLKHQMSE